MKQYKDKIKIWLENNYVFYYIFFAIIMYVLQKLTFSWYGDDVAEHYQYRSAYYSIAGEIKHVLDQGTTWTSRILVYVVGRLAAQLFSRTSYELWFLLNSIFFAIFAYAVANFKETTNGKYMATSVLFLMLCEPYIYYSSAGWYVTIVVYMWPIAFAMICMRFILQIDSGSKKKIASTIFMGLLLVYAVNLECVAIFMTIMIFGVLLSDIIYKKKIKISIIIYELISIVELCFHMLSPGQQARYDSEVKNWFVDFNTFSFFDKLDLGISSTFNKFLFNRNVIFLIFSCSLCLVVWGKYKATAKRIISSVPFAVALVFGVFRGSIASYFPNVIQYINTSGKRGTVTVQSYAQWETYIPLIIGAGVCICIILALVMAFNDKYTVISVFIFLGGVASRIAMGFSPTVWASGSRTYLMMCYSLLILTTFCLEEIFKIFDKSKTKAILGIIGVFATLSYVDALYIPDF